MKRDHALECLQWKLLKKREGIMYNVYVEIKIMSKLIYSLLYTKNELLYPPFSLPVFLKID